MVGTCTFVNYAATIHPLSLCLRLQILYLCSLQFAFKECKQFCRNCRFSFWFWKDEKMSIEHWTPCVSLCRKSFVHCYYRIWWCPFNLSCFYMFLFRKWLKYFPYRNFTKIIKMQPRSTIKWNEKLFRSRAKIYIKVSSLVGLNFSVKWKFSRKYTSFSKPVAYIFSFQFKRSFGIGKYRLALSYHPGTHFQTNVFRYM